MSGAPVRIGRDGNQVKARSRPGLGLNAGRSANPCGTAGLIAAGATTF
jgi:hypothetical protein